MLLSGRRAGNLGFSPSGCLLFNQKSVQLLIPASKNFSLI
ncbi:hypothetical protein KIS4809_0437 [Bacillus sp. ZZV12-4809]|nr:hypothetical protein KIS4809_0437 [Bacillus sp. ZZV12-4809]